MVVLAILMPPPLWPVFSEPSGVLRLPAAPHGAHGVRRAQTSDATRDRPAITPLYPGPDHPRCLETSGTCHPLCAHEALASRPKAPGRATRGGAAAHLPASPTDWAQPEPLPELPGRQTPPTSRWGKGRIQGHRQGRRQRCGSLFLACLALRVSFFPSYILLP